jgi:hypothetical protein
MAKLASADAAALESALVHALSFAIWQARGGPPAASGSSSSSSSGADAAAAPPAVVVSVEGGAEALAGAPLAPDAPASRFRVTPARSFAELEALVRANLPQYATLGGVVLLVYAMLLTRGVERVRGDMDEAGGSLVARFGHCTQELVNLALTGVASSGIFDGVKRMGSDEAFGGGASASSSSAASAAAAVPDALSLRGVTQRPLVGLLSYIEANRFETVGDFLKRPLLPVWIVGSESHFTTLFSGDLGSMESMSHGALFRAFSKRDESAGSLFIAVRAGLRAAAGRAFAVADAVAVKHC